MAPTSPAIGRPQPTEHLEYYAKYITQVPGDDAHVALATQFDATLAVLRALDETRAMHRYAPEKWSVKEVVGHLSDMENEFTNRALRFGRGDQSIVSSVDENAWVPGGRFDRRPLADLLEDWAAIRAATVRIFRSFDAEALARVGVANESPVSVRALAWIIAGHELHHRAILRDRYGIG